MLIYHAVQLLIFPLLIQQGDPFPVPPAVQHQAATEVPATMYQATSDAMRTKTVYLIRHAESNENVIYSGARRLAAALTDCSLPTFSDLGSTMKLPFSMFRSSVVDAEVSEHGREQIEQLHRTLADDGFLFDHKGKRDIVVVHSPLKRAKQTAYGIFKGADAIDNSKASPEYQQQMIPADKSHDRITFEELELLREVNPKELLTQGNRALDRRISRFEKWIENRPEDPIVVVGHSVYFKRMLRLPDVFANCDVWELEYSLQSGAEQKARPVTKDSSTGASMEDHVPPRSWLSMKRVYKYHVEEDSATVVDEE